MMSKKNEVLKVAYVETEYGKVRVVNVAGEAYFVSKDVAGILGFANTLQMTQQVDDANKIVRVCTFDDYTVRIGLINRLGLCDAISASQFSYAVLFGAQLLVKANVPDNSNNVNLVDIKELITDPDFVIKALEQLKEANAQAAELNAKIQKQAENIAAIRKEKQAIKHDAENKAAVIKGLKPKAEFCDMVLKCTNGTPITVIAKDYGWSARKLNEYLHKKKIQFKVGGVWVLYQKYAAEGFMATKTNVLNSQAKTFSLWTQKGRQFIYELLKADGYLPLKVTQGKTPKKAA